MKKLSEELEFFEWQTKRNCREWIDAAKRLEAFEAELPRLVDRLGHDAGAVCDWGRLVPSAETWANAVYEAAEDNRKYERQNTLYLMKKAGADLSKVISTLQKAFEEMEQAKGSEAHSAKGSTGSDDAQG